MSIFKSSFKPFVRNQITARQDLVNSRGTRPLDLQKYVSAKSPWVKMTSFVDYANPKKNGNPDSTLAQKYILCGGTLYPDWNDPDKIQYTLRSGINAKGSAYGTDLGYAGHDKTPKNGQQYGIRPMPGISDVDIKSKSAYGSLREAVVKFYAWDVNQLEDLLILFMRPGYQVLLEWGWSMYIDSENKGNIKSFDGNTINCFRDNITQDFIYDKIEELQKKYSGNYEAMLGVIRNYETSVLPNGGFECAVTLISIGDVIDSLRMNTENGQINNSTDESKKLQDEFEIYLRSFCQSADSLDYIMQPFIKEIRQSAEDINIYHSNEKQKNIKIDTNIYISDLSSDISTNIKAPVTGNNNGSTLNENTDMPGDAAYSYYMQFAYFIHFLNSQKNLYFNDKDKLLNLEIPLPYSSSLNEPVTKKNFGNGLCLGSYDSVTIDNTCCLIQNPNSKVLSKNGFVHPYLYNTSINITINNTVPIAPAIPVNSFSNGFLPPNISTNPVPHILANATMNDYLYEDTNLGIIGNVYVNIGKMIDLYKSEIQNNNGFAYLGKFIKRILKDIQFTLGSINDFDISVQENRMIIIDKHYVEPPSDTRKEEKFQINILGTDSIVRNEKIISKIFPSQATIIAIAAQSRENVASLQSSTYTQMNAGLRNRLLSSSDLSSYANEISDLQKEKDKIFNNNMVSLVEYINDTVLKGSIIINKKPNLSAINTFLNNFLVKYDNATNYRAIVPVSLDITIDGISGITIGEIFRINNDILPREYGDKGIGFIVTRISHKITRPDWTTTLETQFCLLDQDVRQSELYKNQIEAKNKINETINKNKKDLRAAIALYNLLASYFVDLVSARYKIAFDSFSKGSFIITYKESSSKKHLKARLDERDLNFDGENVTVESFLKEVALQSEKSYSVSPVLAVDLYNTRPYKENGTLFFQDRKIIVSSTDIEILQSTKFYKQMAELSSDIKKTFDTNLNEIKNQNKTIFPLINSDLSITEYGQLNIIYFSNLISF
jgi:hypothetical protein